HMPGTTTEIYKRNFINESKRWDYLISPNTYSTEKFRNAFDFNKDIIETGYPRNDFLYNFNKEETINNIKINLNLSTNKKVILYAPTWRDNEYHNIGKYKFNLQLDLASMQKTIGDDFIILLRMHYLIADKIDLSNFKEFAYDLSNHEDIRELYLISDILITDYSSVFFDYANLKRPIIFYMYDIENYRDSLRGFYFNIEQDAPGPVVKYTEEVIEEVLRLSKDNFELAQNFEVFFSNYCYLESGNSSKNVFNNVFRKDSIS
ncbi:CDP-glycerol glycerophosphotransferase family protein, partial [Cytobacillus horneckiae]